ncbi:MAG: ATP synthase F1 subunit gamma [Chitinispirillaceae bacterium]|nr:ATP synthase F1 subunit gamma [Chitinispirillaceae bacterium]
MASIKEYQRKISSLKNTRKITGSMKMISSIKLQRMAKLREAMLPFCKENRSMLQVVSSLSGENSLYINGYPSPATIHYLVVTSDRGMCGRFNTHTIRALHMHIAQREPKPVRTVISCIGQKGYTFLKRHGETIFRNYTGCSGHPSFDTIQKPASDLIDEFTSGTSHELWLVYSRRVSSFSEEPVVERLLPFQSNRTENPATVADDLLLEDSPEVLVRRYASLMVQGMIYEALVETGVAEHAARMSAMDNTSSNCDRMTDNYSQLRNRARQAAITTELSEIVTGKEALQS